MRAAPDPRILTGWSGASPHVLRFPPRAFLRFPVCPPGSPPSPAFLWFPFVRRSPVRSLRPLPGSGSPSVSLRVPFPLGNLHVSAAAGRYRRRRSQAAGTKVTSSAATTSPGSRDPPALQMGSGWPRWDAATESPVMSGAERRTSPRLNRAGGVLRGRPSLRLLSVTDFPSASVLGWQRSRLPTTGHGRGLSPCPWCSTLSAADEDAAEPAPHAIAYGVSAETFRSAPPHPRRHWRDDRRGTPAGGG